MGVGRCSPARDSQLERRTGRGTTVGVWTRCPPSDGRGADESAGEVAMCSRRGVHKAPLIACGSLATPYGGSTQQEGASAGKAARRSTESIAPRRGGYCYGLVPNWGGRGSRQRRGAATRGCGTEHADAGGGLCDARGGHNSETTTSGGQGSTLRPGTSSRELEQPLGMRRASGDEREYWEGEARDEGKQKHGDANGRRTGASNNG